VSGDAVRSGKPAKGSEYLRYSTGALQASCRTTSKYQARLFMPHHATQVCYLGMVRGLYYLPGTWFK
jgi:hypothetical protein